MLIIYNQVFQTMKENLTNLNQRQSKLIMDSKPMPSQNKSQVSISNFPSSDFSFMVSENQEQKSQDSNKSNDTPKSSQKGRNIQISSSSKTMALQKIKIKSRETRAIREVVQIVFHSDLLNAFLSVSCCSLYKLQWSSISKCLVSKDLILCNHNFHISILTKPNSCHKKHPNRLRIKDNWLWTMRVFE